MARVAALALVLGLGSGCTPDPSPLRWEITADDSSLIARIAIVSAEIRRERCDGELVYETEISRTGAMPEAPPVLDDGRYAFTARARDGACREIAEGCTEVDLPTGDLVSVLLAALATPRALCEVAECTAGRCVAGDGGMPDASFDAGTPCGSDFCSECEACESGACVARSDGFVCAEGTGRCVAGACCTGCIDLEGACHVGSGADACGTGGGSCVRCAPCHECVDAMCAPSADGAACGTCGTCASLVCMPGGAPCGPCETCNASGICEAMPDGTSCTDATGAGGTCRGTPSVCCAGCWDLATGACEPGDLDTACGRDGLDCMDCTPDVCGPARFCRGAL